MTTRTTIPTIGLALVCCLGMSARVNADEYSGPYIGGSAGQARTSVDNTDFKETDTAFKVFVGYAISDLMAFEAAYIDGGNPTLDIEGGGSVEAAVTGVNASILLRARKGSAFAFFLKAGYSSYEVEATGLVAGAPIANGAQEGEDISYGIGASYLFAEHLMVRLEYEALDVQDGGFNMATLGLGYKW